MPSRSILITGASGEIGQALIEHLSSVENTELVTVDLKPLPEKLQGKSTHYVGDLLEKDLIKKLDQNHDYNLIFHLAAILSTKAEHNPILAHQVNTCSTVDLLELASQQSQNQEIPVKFLFPSSIAVYGLPSRKIKDQSPPIKEDQWTEPTTMYGCSKLYCEKVGIYYSEYIQQLTENDPVRLDFRAIRFPGIISAFTIPSGGTSDFGPEMIHAAAQGKDYACFVKSDVRIPFMVMPDAVRSLLMLADAPMKNLNQRVYNVSSFVYSAGDFKELAETSFPDIRITFLPDQKRQNIVDSWPADIDDSAARKDWKWESIYNAIERWEDYLLKNVSRQYNN